MNHNNCYSLAKKEFAVISQPVGLLVILIVAAVVLTVFSLSLQGFFADSSRRQIEQQIHTILTEASSMFEYANEGSFVTLHVTFPSSMQFIVFGHLPSNGSIAPVLRTLNENTSNNYYYLLEDGTMKTFHTNARFSNHNMTQNVVFYPGTYDITLELRQREGKTYVTMS